jgi:UTRA domain
MLDLSRLRQLDDLPMAIERLRMPTSRMPWPPQFDFTGSIYEALESQGSHPAGADVFVELVDATAAEARSPQAEACCVSIASPYARMALPSARRTRNTIRIAIDSNPFSNVAPSNFRQSTMLRPYKSRDALRRHRELEFAIATSYQYGSRARCRIGGNQDN